MAVFHTPNPKAMSAKDSGGLSLTPHSVIVSEQPLNGTLIQVYNYNWEQTLMIYFSLWNGTCELKHHKKQYDIAFTYCLFFHIGDSGQIK